MPYPIEKNIPINGPTDIDFDLYKDILVALQSLKEIGESFECPAHCVFIHYINNKEVKIPITCRRQSNGNYRVWRVEPDKKKVLILKCEHSGITKGLTGFVEKENKDGSIEVSVTIYNEWLKKDETVIVLLEKGWYSWIK